VVHGTATITHSATTTPINGYDGISITVTVNIADNDGSIPGIRIVETGGSTIVWEGGLTTDTYSVTLASPPSKDVTVLLPFSRSAFVAKLNSDDGTWEWAELVAIGPDVTGNGIVLGELGKLYVTGTASGSATVLPSLTANTDDVFVSRVSRNNWTSSISAEQDGGYGSGNLPRVF